LTGAGEKESRVIQDGGREMLVVSHKKVWILTVERRYVSHGSEVVAREEWVYLPFWLKRYVSEATSVNFS
jgi:hypothetical protein